MPPSTEKHPIDLALDLLLYAPVGLALSAQEALPKFAELGRERITSQIASARIVGRFAVQQGQARAGKFFGPDPEPAPASPSRDADADADATPADHSAPAPTAAEVPMPPASGQDGSPTAGATAGDDLAIPGYDSLSASQVLPRLEGLAVPELEAVRLYEMAHRGRKTILGRVAQLQSAS